MAVGGAGGTGGGRTSGSRDQVVPRGRPRIRRGNPSSASGDQVVPGNTVNQGDQVVPGNDHANNNNNNNNN